MVPRQDARATFGRACNPPAVRECANLQPAAGSWSWGRKPDSVPGLRRADRHFSRIPRGIRPPKPAKRAEEGATYPGLQDGPSSPLFCLAPDWVFPAAGIAAGAVGSYPTFSPLPRGSEREGESERVSPLTLPFHSNRRAVCSLWHFPSRRLDPPCPGLSRSDSGRQPCGQPCRRDNVSCRESCPRVSGLSSPNRRQRPGCPSVSAHWARV